MGKDFEIELFEGKNTALLHLRIPQAMNDELLLEAKEKGVSVAGIVRDAIKMNLAPKVLGRQVEKGFELAEGENRLDGIVDYYADLSSFCQETEVALRKGQAMKETVKRIRKLVESKFEAVYEREVKKMRLEQESREKARQRQKKQRGVAGLLQPSFPTFLTEDQKATLSQKQKREREFAKLE